jgi:hypothetical protein
MRPQGKWLEPSGLPTSRKFSCAEAATFRNLCSRLQYRTWTLSATKNLPERIELIQRKLASHVARRRPSASERFDNEYFCILVVRELLDADGINPPESCNCAKRKSH